MEARDFRGRHREFSALGAEVVGVSGDSEGRHKAFANALDLPFSLVSDPKSEIAKAYGVARGGWFPSRRATFVIDSTGVVRRVISAEIDIPRHATEALAAVETLANAVP